MNKEKTKLYVNQFLDDCLYKRRLDSKTIKAYKLDLQQFMDLMIEEKDEVEVVKNYLDIISKQYDKVKTVKRKLAVVKDFYHYLVFEGILNTNPFDKIRIEMQEAKRLPKVINEGDLNKLFDYLTSEESLMYLTIIAVLMSTGIRISELTNMKINDLDLNERKIKIFGKGNKERLLYIGNDEVISLLEEYYTAHKSKIDLHGFFFVNRKGDPLSAQSIRDHLHLLEKKLELSTKITPHMFRHTFATKLLENDVDIRYIQKILGHSSITVTQIYTHVAANKQKEILTNKNPINGFHIKKTRG